MRMQNRRHMFLACLAVAVSLGACAGQTDTTSDQNQIRHLLDTYLESIRKADVTLASNVWSHRPDVVVVMPLGRFQGWDSVQRDLYVNFLQKGFLERDLQPGNVHIQVNGNSAWAVFDWTFTGKLANGQPMTSKGWESHVYERTGAGWRIAHLHYSAQLPPPS